jgi:hypothetical protein
MQIIIHSFNFNEHLLASVKHKDAKKGKRYIKNSVLSDAIRMLCYDLAFIILGKNI